MPTWTDSQYQAYAAIFDSFAKYSNTLGVFIGNEVIARANQSEAAPYIKAATRDMKAYRDKKGFRKIPVGYSAADIAELRPMLQNYLTCGKDTEDSIDFYGLNAYEWCASDNDFQTSGYKTLNDMAAGYPVPIFFSETGCNTNRPRLFKDQNAILGPEMNSLWSGAIVYEWIEEQNDYGLISYGPPQGNAVGDNIEGGFLRKGTPTPVQPDFSNLQAVWKTLNPKGTPKAAYKPDITAPACPKSTAGGWLLDGDVPLPTLNQVFTAALTGKPTVTSSISSPTGSGKDQTPGSSGTSGGSPSTTTGSKSPTGTNAAIAVGRDLSGVSGALAAVMVGFAILL
jgi:1,3-beta-glucanosyltransferase GAS1